MVGAIELKMIKVCRAETETPCQWVGYRELADGNGNGKARDVKPYGAGSGLYGSYHPDFSKEERAHLDAMIEEAQTEYSKS